MEWHDGRPYTSSEEVMLEAWRKKNDLLPMTGAERGRLLSHSGKDGCGEGRRLEQGAVRATGWAPPELRIDRIRLTEPVNSMKKCNPLYQHTMRE